MNKFYYITEYRNKKRKKKKEKGDLIFTLILLAVVGGINLYLLNNWLLNL
jgi:uncharacterized membrane-anchored protein